MEGYLEDKKVYETFEALLKQLVINRPENPLDFLIEKLSKPTGKAYKFKYVLLIYKSLAIS